MVGEWLMALEAAIQDAQEAGDTSRPTSTRSSSPSRSTRSAWAPTGPSSSTRTTTAFERARGGDPAAALSDGRADRPHSRSRSTRAPPAAPCATRSPSSSASWPRCSRTARPGDGLDWQVSSPGGPRVLDVGDLEALRDELAGRVEEIRRALRERAEARAGQPRAASRRWSPIPPATSGERVSNDDIGEPGCKY